MTCGTTLNSNSRFFTHFLTYRTWIPASRAQNRARRRRARETTFGGSASWPNRRAASPGPQHTRGRHARALTRLGRCVPRTAGAARTRNMASRELDAEFRQEAPRSDAWNDVNVLYRVGEAPGAVCVGLGRTRTNRRFLQPTRFVRCRSSRAPNSLLCTPKDA